MEVAICLQPIVLPNFTGAALKRKQYFSRMIRGLFIGFLCLFFAGYCSGQSGHTKPKTPKVKTNKPPIVVTQEVDTDKAQNETGNGSALLDVLFATNGDGQLYINDSARGPVSKRDFRYIKMEPGQYSYRVQSTATQDELADTFTVSPGKPNEVFIDLLFLMDEKKAEREFLTNKTGIPDVLHVSNEPLTLKKDTGTIQKNRDAETAVIATLIASMVPVKGGHFIMGNNRGAADEGEHAVTITNLLIGKYEVTQRQWEVIMGYNPSFTKNCPTCPVDNVSWVEAMKFIRKVDVISNKRFRLPTEAEWEYVARLGGRNEIDTSGGQEAYITKTAWNYINANKETHPVGMRQPNAAGLFDMTGNVSEWCFDWYGGTYYKEDQSQRNPEGPSSGKEKVIRGGNFKDFVGDRFRPSFRNKKNPLERASEVGFRLVLEVR